MKTTKKEYEDKAVLVSNSKKYLQTEKYEIEFLWTKLGNYAQDENVEIRIDVVNSSAEGLYDLNFAIAGKYAKVADFLYDLENDSKLGFKVEDFHMNAVENGVQGTFSCKEIGLNIEQIEAVQENRREDEQSEENNTTNTQETNTADTTNTTNTTNETETNNTTSTNATNETNTNAQ